MLCSKCGKLSKDCAGHLQTGQDLKDLRMAIWTVANRLEKAEWRIE